MSNHTLNIHAKAIIDDILISGSGSTLKGGITSRRTNNSYFDNEFSNVFKSSRVNTVLDVHEKLQKVYSNVLASGLFEIVEIDYKLNSFDTKNDVYHTSVHVKVKEKGIPYLKMESYVQSNAAAVSTTIGNTVGFELQGSLRNPSGNGEDLRLSMGNTSTGKQDKALSLNVPHLIVPGSISNLAARITEDSSSTHFTSFTNKVQSIVADFTAPNKRHQVTAELTLRNEIPLPHQSILHACDASLPVMNLVSSSVKSSIKYSYAIDQRDQLICPTSGGYLSTSVEVAVPPGDAQFLRSEVQMQQHYKLLSARPYSVVHKKNNDGLVLSLIGSLGIIQPLQSLISRLYYGATQTSQNEKKESELSTVQPLSYSQDKVFLSDRYNSGGPLQFRGFSLYGISAVRANHLTSGGSLSGDSLGSLVRLSMLACLTCPLPLPSNYTASGMLTDSKAILFTNFGTFGKGNFNLGAPNFIDFFGYPRLSIGSGFVLNISNAARLELTYSLPIIKAKQDITKSFQIGIGLTIN